jgi:hypothetical protein
MAEGQARKLGVEGLVTASYIDDLYAESDGHPYVAKVLLGEAARSGKVGTTSRVMASQERILDALFERTLADLSPSEQRVFLTLCNWKSLVPRVALEGALMRPENERMDVGRAIDVLERSSLIEIVSTEEHEGEFLRVPLAAYIFGQKKLRVSPFKAAIDADTEILQSFGPMKSTDAARGLRPRVDQMVRWLAGRRESGADVKSQIDVLEYMARDHPFVWLRLADLYESEGAAGRDGAIRAVTSYLESCPEDTLAWRRLAELHWRSGNGLGEIHARMQIVELGSTDYIDLHRAALSINSNPPLSLPGLDPDARREMIRLVSSEMERRIDEASAGELSQLAWLYLGLRREEDARRCVQLGLEMDPTNYHCLNLQERMTGRSVADRDA